jgi:hypothetical protein
MTQHRTVARRATHAAASKPINARAVRLMPLLLLMLNPVVLSLHMPLLLLLLLLLTMLVQALN